MGRTLVNIPNSGWRPYIQAEFATWIGVWLSAGREQFVNDFTSVLLDVWNIQAPNRFEEGNLTLLGVIFRVLSTAWEDSDCSCLHEFDPLVTATAYTVFHGESGWRRSRMAPAEVGMLHVSLRNTLIQAIEKTRRILAIIDSGGSDAEDGASKRQEPLRKAVEILEELAGQLARGGDSGPITTEGTHTRFQMTLDV
jgi:hypothetical protein